MPEALEQRACAADAVADRLAHSLGLLVDLLEHEGLVAALYGALVVPVDLGHGRRRLRSRRRWRPRAVIVTTWPSSRNCTRRVLDRNAAIDEARNISPSPTPTTSGVWQRTPTSSAGWSWWIDDEGEVALELRVRRLDGGGEITGVGALDQVDDDLRVGLGAERCALGDQGLPQLAVVLDDPVQHDRELVVVAAGERVRVLVRNRAVGRPARVAEPGRRRRAVRAGGRLQLLEVADRARCSRDRRPRAGRSRRSRSRGTRGARGPAAAAASGRWARRIR